MYYHIINHCSVRLWSVSQQDRIEKVLAKAGNLKQLNSETSPEQNDMILILRADYLFDANVLGKFMAHPCGILNDSSARVSVAAWVKYGHLEKISALLATDSLVEAEGHEHFTPMQLTGGYDPRLRKFDLSHVVEVTAERQRILENYLYDKSYKGITDLVTKWWWPLPARAVVRKCVGLKLTPNMVTSVGWLLTFISGFAFYFGFFFLTELS